MSDEKGYYGWTNYETWCVALWIDNEEGSYHERRAMARQARSVHALADSLKAWVEEMAPDLGASLFADLLNTALSEVDWRDIAESWYTEAHEDETASVEGEDG